MSSSPNAAFGQSTQALEDLLLQNHLLPTSSQVSHCKEALELLCYIILGKHFYSVPNSDPKVYASIVDGVTLVLAPSGSYGLDAWEPSAIIPCSIAGTPSYNTFFDLAGQRIDRAKDSDVILLKAKNDNGDVVFEVDIQGVKFCFQYFQSKYAREWSTKDITELLGTDIVISKTTHFEIFSDTARLRRTIPNMGAFSLSFRFAKLWALRRGLMSSRFGYLNDRTLMMMVARIFLVGGLDHTQSIQSVMERFFRYLSRSDYKTGSRGLWVPSVDGSRNISNVESRTVLEWLRTELQVSTKHMDDTTKWTWSSLAGDPAERHLLQFLTNEPHYIQVDVSHWGASPSLGAKFFDWIDEKVSQFYKELCDFCSACYPRAWPKRLICSSESSPNHTHSHYEGYKAFYVIHLKAADTRTTQRNPKEPPVYNDITNGLESRVSRLVSQIREDKQFDKECCFVDISMHTTLSDYTPHCVVDTKDWGLIPCEVTKLPNSTCDDDTKFIIEPPDFAVTPSSHFLRPAHEILERLRWDPTYDICKYVIGYKDRHEGLMEMTADKWMKRAKFEEKDWIPESRIQYYKEKGSRIRVWDRTTRTDLIFK